MKLNYVLIDNLLIIKHAHIDLSDGLSVISGETGAGKTVLTRVFDLLSGAPGKEGLIRQGAKDAYVEALWELSLEEQQQWQHIVGDVTDIGEYVTTARRMVGKRSTGFVNGRSCPLDMLRTLSQQALMLYGQYEQDQLIKPEQQRIIVDKGLGTQELWQKYAQQRQQTRMLAQQQKQLQEQAHLAEREAALIQHEFDELVNMNIESNEADTLFAELQTLTQSREQSHYVIDALDKLQSSSASAQAALAMLHKIDIDTADLTKAIESLNTTEYNLAQYTEYHVPDEEREAVVQERLGLLHDLARKHRCQPHELNDVLKHHQQRLQEIHHVGDKLEEVERAYEKSLQLLQRHGHQLSKQRAAKVERWTQSVQEQLPSVALEGMQIKVVLQPTPDSDPLQQASLSGFESVRLSVQASPGLPWGNIEESASGGERSRLMLALIGLDGAGEHHVVVMDEPDTGIGGTTAHGIGERLFQLAASQQTIVVSHLSQIALRAHRHYVVKKTLHQTSTETTIAEVVGEERIDELCRMSGYDITDTASRDIVKKSLAQYGAAERPMYSATPLSA